MKRLMMLGMIGCVAGCVPIDPTAGRTTFAEAREACEDWVLPVEFEVAVDLVRGLRQDGLSVSSALVAALVSCSNNCGPDRVCTSSCTVCSTTLISAVYDN